MDIINYALLKQAYTASVDVSKFLDKYEMSKLLKGKYEFEGACIIIEAGSEGMRSEVHNSCSFSLTSLYTSTTSYQQLCVK